MELFALFFAGFEWFVVGFVAGHQTAQEQQGKTDSSEVKDDDNAGGSYCGAS